jgi:hypothetical protein
MGVEVTLDMVTRDQITYYYGGDLVIFMLSLDSLIGI